MSKLDLLDLYTRLCGFKILVRANRFGCETRFSQVVHDRLLEALTSHIESCKRALSLKRELRVERDFAMREALHEMLDDCLGDLAEGGAGFYPWHLLDAVDRDPSRGGYLHPVFAIHVGRAIPEWMTVADEHLNGLDVIIKQIAAETGITFTTYLCGMSIGPDGAKDLDAEVYQKPIENYRYQ